MPREAYCAQLEEKLVKAEQRIAVLTKVLAEARRSNGEIRQNSVTHETKMLLMHMAQSMDKARRPSLRYSEPLQPFASLLRGRRNPRRLQCA